MADKFGIDYRFAEAAKPKRVAIMASTEDHCLLDLLWRNRRGELEMSVVMVIANHPDPRYSARGSWRRSAAR
ncbi:formyltetrahydrofolate deformylase [Mycobacterium tuberculosis]|uniref:Formyltetrahydrofolate deformylase n=1 Tax=Mycobacterium tuberculosis TaxID=1773 RepID=A0A655AVW8_MYCTX|nr:formyltetrahydrofolate deformylase [Mycobacterium tuberculosis]